MRLLVTVVGAIAIGIGVVGIVAPEVLLDFGRSLQTPVFLYVIAVLRVGMGFVLIRAATVSRVPMTFRVLGVILMVVGVLTPLFGLERTRALLDWWSTHGLMTLRAGTALAAVFGIFLILAVTRR